MSTNVDREHVVVTDPLGNNIKVPITVESGDWQARCKTCGRICGGTAFGRVPNSDDWIYVSCPTCNHSGEPFIVWEKVP